MTEYLLILVSTILVNNFVLVQFLGLCPFMGVSGKLETAMGMSLATTFVLTLSSVLAYLTWAYILVPFELEYLRTISFILVIAVAVQFTEMFVKKASPLLYRVLGVFLPLITSNCAVLGVALLNVRQSDATFMSSLTYGLGAALGFSLVLILFAAMRERIAVADVPEAVREITRGVAAAATSAPGVMLPTVGSAAVHNTEAMFAVLDAVAAVESAKAVGSWLRAQP